MTLRHEAEQLRAKYARVFDVPLETVTIEYDVDDAAVQAPGLPRWTTGNVEYVPRDGSGG